jgi:multicomponent K+:H+ antiporter subunit E
MKRIPPVFLAVLVLTWLLLNTTASIGHIVLGTALSGFLLATAAQLRPLQPKMRKGYVLVRLAGLVLIDVVRSNIGVARVILGFVGNRVVGSGFIQVPLDLRDPHGLATLAMIITVTPGTVWVELTADKSTLTIHVLDLVDEGEWVRRIKERYERALMEVFE